MTEKRIIIPEKWVVIDSGGRIMLKAVGEPQIICTLETVPLKITSKIHARAHLIAAAPELLAACEEVKPYLNNSPSVKDRQLAKMLSVAIAKTTKD